MSRSSKFKPPGTQELWDMEDWIEGGKELHACPYYASQYKMKDADIVFCPYNYLIDPSFSQFFFYLKTFVGRLTLI
jgi:Rad3-related DNA helicase